MGKFINYAKNSRNIKILILTGLILIGYGFGGLTVYKQLFPFEYILYAKNALIDGGANSSSPPKPRNSIFETFVPHADVVMIGDSIVAGAEWRDIFPDIKIVNRGIGGDKTADVLRRIDPIIALKPKKAFLMIGINDVYQSVSIDNIFDNYVKIIGELRSNGVDVYLQSTIECSKSKCGDKLKSVRLLNDKLYMYSLAENLSYIDINNGIVSDEDGLLPEYTYDGIHLLGGGYLKWSQAIAPFLLAD